MPDDTDPHVWPGDVPSVVRLGAGGRRVDGRRILARHDVELKGAEARAELAKTVVDRQGELLAWVEQDEANAQLLLEQPAKALALALPGVDPVEVVVPSGALLGHVLAGAHLTKVAEKVVPETAQALALLREVADDAAASPGGFADLTADTSAAVTRVAAGRYSAVVVQRTIEAVLRGRGIVTISLPPTTTIPSGVLLTLRENPAAAAALEHAVVVGGDDVR
ncbi:hypothetical protein [Cellulomonas sp. ICMP 17802]|uniref:hypothetical protein n=1 Tax=Cellulomonas sp. ICMP 17802 TaxID=3239199 RepID=UPI00351B0ED5